jgi:hypothetical protein
MLAYVQLLSTRAGQRAFRGLDAEIILVRGKALGSAPGRLNFPYWAASQPVLKIRATVMHASNANLMSVWHFSTSAVATSNDMSDVRLTDQLFCLIVRGNGKRSIGSQLADLL